MLEFVKVLALFPGVVLHELAHHMICIACRVPVRRVVYFQRRDPAGYVTHLQPPLFRQTLLIAVGPLLVNSLAAYLLFRQVVPLARLQPMWLAWCGVALVVWLGGSAALQAWPSRGDIANLWAATRYHTRRLNLLALVGLPISFLLLAVDASRQVKGHWLFGVMIAALALQEPA